MPAMKGLGGGHTGRSNGLNADGSLMNVGNKLGDRPSIRLFTQYSSSSQMEQALSDDWIYGKEPTDGGRAPDSMPAYAAPGHAAQPRDASHRPGPGQKRRALPSGVGYVAPGGQPQRWRTRPHAVDTNGDALRAIEDDEVDWDVGGESTGLTPRAQHMQLAEPLVHGPGFTGPSGTGHHRAHPVQGAVVAHQAAARRQTEQVAAANQLIVQQNLWHAIRAGKRQMVRRAVEDDGGDPMAGNPDEAGITAVHLAAKLSKIGLLEYLLSLPGVDPKVKDRQGRTPADLATNADIRDLLAGHREELLHRPPPPPGGPSWGAASRAKSAAAAATAAGPEARRALAANAAEARAGGDASKPWPRRARHNEDDPINPREVDVGDDDLSVSVTRAAARMPDAPPTPVKLLGKHAGGVDLEPAGGVVAAAAKSAAAAAQGKAARGSGGGRGPVTKDLFTDGGPGRGSGSSGGSGSNRGSVSSEISTAGAAGGHLDADGFPVIEGPPQVAVGAAAELGQDDFLR